MGILGHPQQQEERKYEREVQRFGTTKYVNRQQHHP
jgi:hypothetical protein